MATRRAKRWLAALITGTLLVVVLWQSRRPPAEPGQSGEGSPESSVQRMFTAAENGDVAAYLDCFAGEERRRLERDLADQSRDAFARSLKQAVVDLKGRAVFAPARREPGAGETELTVERIYANRTERQTYRLRREADRWRIESVRSAESYQPATPYGTPVFELPPAGDRAPPPPGQDVPSAREPPPRAVNSPE